MNRCLIKCGLVLLLCVFFNTQAAAMPRFLNWWLAEYQELDSSSDSVCQLCHERPGGGNGWNEYGWNLLIAFNILIESAPTEQEALLRALRAIEEVNTDISDLNSPTYIDEINAGTQPGWREGAVNLIRFTNTSPDQIIAPPDNLPCGVMIDQSSNPLCSVDKDEICFPIKSSNEQILIICM